MNNYKKSGRGKSKLFDDPDSSWNVPELVVDDGLTLIETLIVKVDDIPPKVWKTSYEFLSSMKEKLVSIRKSICDYQKYTVGQRTALENMSQAIDKCANRAKDGH
jgi:hypothetical protein